SHEDLPLSAGLLEGDRLECIWHGATFDVCSGQATGLPAIRPVRTFDVDIRDAEIFVDLD
ncbi:MAG: Rieske 2Fe-2S domain-containing protein, partial [Thermoplasmata archaeon]|nr:Rieske 2Fe-2S domain-containing protein [Thermoplasmata archaeon]NIW84912.1 Rieske 2Fe-2S domain-containing protein [Thermoplasmata archaeon]